MNIGEDAELVKRTVKARGYTAPVVLDAGGEVSGASAVKATPTVYLTDRRSQVGGRAIGRRDWGGELGRRSIQALLAP